MNRKNKLRLIFLLIVFLIFESIWLLNKIHTEIKSPSLHPIAQILLVCQSLEPNNRSPHCKNLKNEKHSLYFWPKNGVKLTLKENHFKLPFIETLKELYPQDFNKLPKHEIEELSKFVRTQITQSLFKMYQLNTYFNQDFKMSVSDSNLHDISLKLSPFVGHSRYSWLGIEKTLYFNLVKKGTNDWRVYFMTLSDIADKFSFLKAIYLPYLFSVLTGFIILYLMS